MRNNRKSYRRRGGAPTNTDRVDGAESVESGSSHDEEAEQHGVATPEQLRSSGKRRTERPRKGPKYPYYRLSCTDYKECREVNNPEKKYIKYRIDVEGENIDKYTIWRRWSLCNTLHNNCRDLRGHKFIKNFGTLEVTTKYTLGFPSPFRRGNEERKELLNSYFTDFSGWLNRIALISEGDIDLMKKPTGPGKSNIADPNNDVVKFFFEKTSQTPTETVSCLTADEQLAIDENEGAKELENQPAF